MGDGRMDYVWMGHYNPNHDEILLLRSNGGNIDRDLIAMDQGMIDN
jgi:hypothetical protein